MTFAAADGGIVRSLDDGVTWNLSQQGLRNSGITTFAVDTSNPSLPVIYASFSQGLFKTADKGAHWIKLSDDSAITRIKGMIVSDSALIVTGDLRSRVTYLYLRILEIRGRGPIQELPLITLLASQRPVRRSLLALWATEYFSRPILV